MIYLVSYLVFCLLWACFAVFMQRFIFDYSHWIDTILCFVVNFLLCPLSIIIAISGYFNNAYWVPRLKDKLQEKKNG